MRVKTVLYIHFSSRFTDIKVVTKKWGNENSWIFGNCANSQTYKSKQIYTEKCCQLECEYELICKDSFGDGWHGGYLEIDGTKYCTDFKQGSEQATEAPMSGMHYITMVFYRFGRLDLAIKHIKYQTHFDL